MARDEPTLRDDLRARSGACCSDNRPLCELGLDLIPGTGLLAAAVPAAFGAWVRLLRDHGTMPLSECSPRRSPSREGFPLVPRSAPRSRGANYSTPSGRARRRSTCWATAQPGNAIPQPGLSARPRRVLAEAESAAGDRSPDRARAGRGTEASSPRRSTASAAATRSGRPAAATGACSPAPISPAGRRPSKRRSAGYRGYTLLKAGPWSQAPVALQQLALLAGFDLAGLTRRIPSSSTPRSNAPSSRSPIARPSMAIPPSSRCRWPSCCRALQRRPPQAGR